MRWCVPYGEPGWWRAQEEARHRGGGHALAHRAEPGRCARRSRALEAAMRLRAHRRNLAAWSPSVGAADRYGAPRLTRLARTRWIHRFIRTGALLTVIGLRRLARAVRPRWRPLLAGGGAHGGRPHAAQRRVGRGYPPRNLVPRVRLAGACQP